MSDNLYHKKRFFLLIACLVSFLIYSNTVTAAIRAQIDRSEISVNESFNLQFVSNDAVDADPDFSPLSEDFEIVNTSKNSNTSIINGAVTRSYVWSLTVFPKRAGRLVIPQVSFGNDKSNPLSLIVTENKPAAAKQESIFIEVEATPKDPYVQAQVIYTVRLFLDAEVANASLSEPELEPSKAILKKLGEDKEYQSWRDSRKYRVYERRYVIYPQQSGPLEIDPIQFNARLLQRSRSFFDPFGTSGRLLRTVSEPIKLMVRAVPKTFKAQNWLPSAHLKLTETWAEEPPVFKVGEPITRSITLTAAGLTASQIPEFKLPEIEGFKLYPDQPYTEDQANENGFTGLRQEKIAMIPTRAGEYILPKIEIPWWDTLNQEFKVAHIPERKIIVSASKATSPNTDTQTTTRTQSDTTITADNKPIKHQASTIWQWLTALFATLWLGTTFLWWYNHRNHNKPRKVSDQQQSLNRAKGNLKKACHTNDAQKTKAALLDWAKAVWPHNPPTNLNQIANHVDNTFKLAILELNNQLYSKQASTWDGQALWSAFQNTNIKKTKNTDAGKNLEPLNRIGN